MRRSESRSVPAPGRAARVMANGIPKSGTHLLRKLAALVGYAEHPLCVATEVAREAPIAYSPLLAPLLGRGIPVGATSPRKIHRRLLARRLRDVPPGHVFHAHCGFDAALADLLAAEQIAVVCVIRDPRDVAMSLVHFLRSVGHRGFLALGGPEAELRFAILGGTIATADGTGTQTFQPLARTCADFHGWCEREDAVVAKFEDLVGAAGGGDDAVQAREIERVARHFAPDADLAGVRERLFGGTATFHRGRIGGWREVFGPAERALCRESGLDDYLVRAGYESSLDW